MIAPYGLSHKAELGPVAARIDSPNLEVARSAGSLKEINCSEPFNLGGQMSYSGEPSCPQNPSYMGLPLHWRGNIETTTVSRKQVCSGVTMDTIGVQRNRTSPYNVHRMSSGDKSSRP